LHLNGRGRESRASEGRRREKEKGGKGRQNWKENYFNSAVLKVIIIQENSKQE
jgi:hypothetical protein